MGIMSFVSADLRAGVRLLTLTTERIHSVLKGSELEALTNEMKLCYPQLKRTSYGKQVMAIEKLLYGMSVPPSATSNSSHNSSISGPSMNDSFDEHAAIGPQMMGQASAPTALPLNFQY